MGSATWKSEQECAGNRSDIDYAKENDARMRRTRAPANCFESRNPGPTCARGLTNILKGQCGPPMTCFSFRWRFWSACLTIFSLCSALLISNAELAAQDSTAQQTPTRPIGLKVGRFPVDVRTEYTLAD